MKTKDQIISMIKHYWEAIEFNKQQILTYSVLNNETETLHYEITQLLSKIQALNWVLNEETLREEAE